MSKRKLKYDYDLIYQMHLAGESILKISKDMNVPIQTIYTHFQKMNWNYSKNIQIREDKYFVNDSYLDNIDSEDKAYFLGWMLSDGNVSKNRITIKLEQSDEYIIKEMFGRFSTGYKISDDKNSKSMSLSSTKLVTALKILGCVENKTEVGFNLPNIPEELFRHFVRGYFDGDGSIGIRSARPNQIQVSICSIDENFLIQLQGRLKDFNITSIVYKEVRNNKLLKRPDGENYINNKDMFRLVVSSHEERLKFYELLYKDCTIKLIRKYEKYKEYYDKTTSVFETKINNEELVLKLYSEGKSKFAIHKETGIGRCVIENILT